MTETSNKPNLSSPQKPRNIILRYNCPRDTRGTSEVEHPEVSHILKYAPKYYKSLTIEGPRYNPLLSKIKKIKRLKRFRGLMNGNPSQPFWLNLLANTRKDIEEIPLIAPNHSQLRFNRPFWAELYHQNLKSFFNITRIDPQNATNEVIFHDQFMNSMIRNSSMRYLRNMRKLKRLKISVNSKNYNDVKWFFGKLDQMNRLLSTVEDLKLEILEKDVPISELFQHKNLLSSLTSLKFCWSFTEFDPSLCVIPQSCSNLKSISIRLSRFFTESLDFPEFLRSLHKLPNLIHINFGWSRDSKTFLSYFKPQNSLRFLTLSFNAAHILREGLFGIEDRAHLLEMIKSKGCTTTLYTDFAKHWNHEIKELKRIQFNVSWNNPEDMIISKLFITGVLKKVQRLTSFKYKAYRDTKLIDHSDKYEPFIVDEVPHLYESLERFEACILSASLTNPSHIIFDLKKMKVFRNLKMIKLDGEDFSEVDIEEAIELLQRNQREGDLPLLKLRTMKVALNEDLQSILERISEAKMEDKSLKIELNLYYYMAYGSDEVSFLSRFCEIMKEVNPIKGLVMSLDLNFEECIGSEPDYDEVAWILSQYPNMRNLKIWLDYLSARLEYIKVDGQVEQLFAQFS